MDSFEQSYIRGVACAAAFVAQQDTKDFAQEVVAECGFSKEHLIKAKVEQCDIDAIYAEEEE